MSAELSRTQSTPHRGLLRETVFERLHADIIDGRLEPGRRLRDAELTVRFGVSRTPLREALARLEELGLVHTAPNRFTRVAPLASEAVFESLETLRALTPMLSALLVDRLHNDALLEAEYLSLRIERLPADDTVGAIGLLLRFAQERLDDLELVPAITEIALTRLMRYVRQRPGILSECGGTSLIRTVTDTLALQEPERTAQTAILLIDAIRAAIRAEWASPKPPPAVRATTQRR